MEVFLPTRATSTGGKIFCVSQPEEITCPVRDAGDQIWFTLNYDAALTSHLFSYPSALTEQIANSLDSQLPPESRRTAHLASLRDARVNVYQQIQETEHQLSTWSLHGSIDWMGGHVYLNAEDKLRLSSTDFFELVSVPGTPFNARALRLLKKLELLRNWSRLIDHAISVMVRCSKRRRHPSSQFLSKIRWHLVHGCHPPDLKPVHVSDFSRLGCAA